MNKMKRTAAVAAAVFLSTVAADRDAFAQLPADTPREADSVRVAGADSIPERCGMSSSEMALRRTGVAAAFYLGGEIFTVKYRGVWHL